MHSFHTDPREGDPTDRRPDMGDEGSTDRPVPIHSLHELSCMDRHAQLAADHEYCPDCEEDLRPLRDLG